MIVKESGEGDRKKRQERKAKKIARYCIMVRWVMIAEIGSKKVRFGWFKTKPSGKGIRRRGSSKELRMKLRREF